MDTGIRSRVLTAVGLTLSVLIGFSVPALATVSAGSRAVSTTTPGVSTSLLPDTPGYLQLWSAAHMADDYRSNPPTEAEAVAAAERVSLMVVAPNEVPNFEAAMHAANPDLRTLIYLNGTYATPAEVPHLPSSWFARTAQGAEIKHLKNTLMNFSNPGWIENRVEDCQALIASQHTDGCYLDMMGVVALAPGYDTGLPIDPATGEVWTQQAYVAALSVLGDAVEAVNGGIPVAGNGLSQGTRYYKGAESSRDILDFLDAGHAETWLRTATVGINDFPSVPAWLEGVNMLTDAGTRFDKPIMAQTKVWLSSATPAEVDQWHRYALASFLLGTTGTSYFTFSAGRTFADATADSPYNHVPIGDATAPFSQQASGVYVRPYANGYVAVDPTSSPELVELPGTYTDLDGSQITAETLAPDSGDIYTLVQTGSPVATSPVLPSSISPLTVEMSTTAATEDGCGCSPPSPDVAVSPHDFVQVSEAGVSIYTSTGSLLTQQTDSAVFAGAPVDDPRVLWDSATSRFVLVADETGSSQLLVAVTRSSDPTRGWIVNAPQLTGDQLAPGATLSDVQLGLDGYSLLVTATVAAGEETNGMLAVIPLADLGTAGSPTVSAFPVEPETAPTLTVGPASLQPGETYLAAADTNNGGELTLYALADGGADPTLTEATVIPMPYAAPPPVTQPGGGVLLSAGDGSLAGPLYQDRGLLWGTHDIDDNGMAEVQYFAVDLSTFLVTTAVAYQTPTSQDFNPALAVADNGVDGVVYLTWAYTDVERGIPVTLTVGWVGPGDPITDLLSEGSDVVSSSAAGTTAPYGPTSGIAVATGTKGACNPYRAVVITGEYFSSDGSWVSPVSEVGDCGRSS